MTELDALRALRRERAVVPAGARERGRRRVEALLEQPPRRTRRAVAALPGIVAVAVALAVAGLLLVAPRPQREDLSPATPHGLGVLRRPQSAAERAIVRRAATDRFAALPKFAEPRSVRILAPGVYGRDVFLYLQGRAMCVYYPDVEGGGMTCTTAARLDQERMIGTLGKQGYGLVPDDVSRVVLHFPRRQISIAPENNFWQVRMPGATPSAIVWKDAQGRDVDPAHAPQRSVPIGSAPPPKVTTTELPARIEVLPGRRVRFTPPTGRHRYEITLSCGRVAFDGAVTGPLPAGQVATVPLDLAAARDQCPGRAVLAGVVVALGRPSARVVLGRFKLAVR